VLAFRRNFRSLVAVTALLFLGGGGCRQAMYDDTKLEPLSESDFFPDGSAARPLVPNTVARGFLREDELLYTGLVNGHFAESFPFPVNRGVLNRGRERYDIFCAVCHGPGGHGNGMIVQRGFPVPPSFHGERLRQAPPGHIFYVITHGYGAMYSYASRVPPEDRWAIAAYIQALQLSRSASLSDVPQADRADLENGRP
jgi:hypothetical protein